jgi:two-component system sensor histidine kinase CiaH
MFESARVKLTLFYLGVLVGFSILLTWSFRVYVSSEFNHANDVQRGAFHRIGQLYFNNPTSIDDLAPPSPDQNFAAVQKAQAQRTQDKLTKDAVWLNVGVIALGAVVSYWYAGRTLKPIEEAHERQKRFTSDASHELRTPLATMRLENEIFLRQDNFSDQEVREQIGSNLEEVARLERLTTSLLDLNRYATAPLQHQKLAVQDLVTDAIGHTERIEAAKNITFKNTTTKGVILGDKESLEQLLGIILDNAVKYGPATGKIEISSKETDMQYTIIVRDHGKGIPEVDLPHIFERMYRGDTARSNTIAGHGIGLSLAEQIATANDASIAASNHPKGGAIFQITLAKP